MVNTSKQFIVLILVGFLCVLVVSLAGCKKETEPAEPTVTEVIDGAEQKLCPVMDAPINKELYTEYKGKNVYFCCPGCEEKFEKEPEKYMDKLPQFK